MLDLSDNMTDFSEISHVFLILIENFLLLL